ncbi:MAG: hypothetical protein PSY12_05430 [bacterium]|nr:hypothetical protein [bacterium]
MRRLFLILLLAIGAVGAWQGSVGRATLAPLGLLPDAITDPALARSDYVENCGGCHGVQGSAAPAELPELRGRSRTAGSSITSNWPIWSIMSSSAWAAPACL